MEPIFLKHAKNYRDIGGIKTSSGKILKKGMLIRGTALSKLSEGDILRLKEEYNLRTIIDLRTRKEAEEKPDKKIDGVSYHLMPVFDEAVIGISHEKKVHSIKSLIALPSMESLYEKMVNPENLPNITAVLRKILLMPVNEFSVVFHCSAGKDRTGVLAALLLTFLGADRNDVIDDYLYTNKGKWIKANLAYVGGVILKRNRVFARKVKNYLLAEEANIRASLASIEKTYGSLENYFAKELKFSDDEVIRIKDKFLELPSEK
ncbi:MAG: tyrosine-protein phosphatase [Treponemataceae bacterium]|jgi:protein-tyrosine phosphatase|nr:tyrosine-protein phosphatase [Treponemataceae bacterium]